MPLSAVLEVAVGLSFLFATLSLIASGAHEMLAAVLALRAKTLQKGVANLLADPGKAEAIYAHPLIRSLYRDKRRPSYIPREKFALAFVDTYVQPAVGSVAGQVAAVDGAIAGLPEGRIRESLDVLWRDARGDAARFRHSVETWFDDSMERVSGWYRRLTQAILFGLGVLLAVGMNINAVTVAQQLWSDAPLRAAVAATATKVEPPADDGAESVKEQLDDVQTGIKTVEGIGLPIGWTDSARPSTWYGAVAGWLFTAVAISMGAPFWFDLLGRVARIRTTGVRTQTAVPQSADTEPKK